MRPWWTLAIRPSGKFALPRKPAGPFRYSTQHLAVNGTGRVAEPHGLNRPRIWAIFADQSQAAMVLTALCLGGVDKFRTVTTGVKNRQFKEVR